MDSLIDFLLSQGKLRVFISVFLIIFVIASSLFCILIGPFAVFGATTWKVVFGGAVGCGIGSAIVHATVCAIHT